MSVKRIKTDSSLTNSAFKLGRGNASAAIPNAPTIGTATAGELSASVAFTPSDLGATASLFTATSSPGSITATSASSPISVTSLTGGTSYTFTVTATGVNGVSAPSSASNSVTPTEPATSYESIATITLTSDQSSITFNSIPSTYKHLQIRGITQNNEYYTASQSYKLQFNSDTNTNYSYHGFYGNSAGTGIMQTASYSAIAFYDSPRIGNGANYYGPFILDILDYADTNKYKTTRTLCGFDINGSGYIGLYSGNWRSTSAITSITLSQFGYSYSANSTFALYGIRG